MSLRTDRILSMVDRYARNMLEASTLAELCLYIVAYSEFVAQFDDATRERMNRVLAVALTGGLYVDLRRPKGKRR